MYHSKFTGTPSEFNVSMSEMNIQIIRLSSNFRYFTMRTEKISEFEAAQIVQTHIDDIKSEIYGPKRGQSPAD